jgi:hypothetical protein
MVLLLIIGILWRILSNLTSMITTWMAEWQQKRMTADKFHGIALAIRTFHLPAAAGKQDGQEEETRLYYIWQAGDFCPTFFMIWARGVAIDGRPDGYRGA